MRGDFMCSFDPRYRDGSVSGDLTHRLYRISRALTLFLRDKGQAFGISLAQLEALQFLAYARRDVRTVGGLAQRLGCTPATASVVIDALERKELAVRVPSPRNRRVVALSLTDTGAETAARLAASLDEFEAIVRGLSPEEQLAALQATEQLVRDLADRGWITVYDVCPKCKFFRPDARFGHPSGAHYCALMEAPLAEMDIYYECPDFYPLPEEID
jgi:DNA-binding MarR family transcriptional regulator